MYNPISKDQKNPAIESQLFCLHENKITHLFRLPLTIHKKSEKSCLWDCLSSFDTNRIYNSIRIVILFMSTGR